MADPFNYIGVKECSAGANVILYLLERSIYIVRNFVSTKVEGYCYPDGMYALYKFTPRCDWPLSTQRLLPHGTIATMHGLISWHKGALTVEEIHKLFETILIILGPCHLAVLPPIISRSSLGDSLMCRLEMDVHACLGHGDSIDFNCYDRLNTVICLLAALMHNYADEVQRRVLLQRHTLATVCSIDTATTIVKATMQHLQQRDEAVVAEDDPDTDTVKNTQASIGELCGAMLGTFLTLRALYYLHLKLLNKRHTFPRG
jgi:hypothetical protein